MKRKIVAFGVILLTLWAFSSVHAALVWQTTPDPQAFQYAINKNGGTLYDGGMNFLPSASEVQTKSSANGDAFSSIASANLSKFDGGVQMGAWTASGSNPTNGVKVSGYTSFSIGSAAYSVATEQEITSFVSRRFSVTGSEIYDLAGSLSGTANFATITGIDYHALKTIGGTINIDEFIMSAGSLTANGTIATLGVSDANRNGLQSVQFRAVDEFNNPVIYQITAILNMKTDIKNFNLNTFAHTGDLFGTWNLGSSTQPFSLQATLSSPVPIPAPLLLFVSGLGGLGLLRRRMKLS